MRPLFAFLFFMAILSSEAQPIKVMTYNIRYDTPQDSVNQWPKRADKVYALIKKYDPDLIGLQEVMHHQLMDLLQNLPAYYLYRCRTRSMGKQKENIQPSYIKKIDSMAPTKIHFGCPKLLRCQGAKVGMQPSHE
jgi:mRNA deadenylase 3'-5' endonuclease subunit Ccr4